jgi:hypothetical protein
VDRRVVDRHKTDPQQRYTDFVAGIHSGLTGHEAARVAVGKSQAIVTSDYGRLRVEPDQLGRH